MIPGSVLPALLAGAGVLAVMWAAGLIGSEALAVGVAFGAGIALWGVGRRTAPAEPVAEYEPPAPEPPAPDPDDLGGRIPFPLLLLGPDGIVRYANEPAASLFGEAAAGSHVSTAIRDPGFSDALNEARRSSDWREIDFGLGRDPERHFRAWIRASRNPETEGGAEERDLLVCLDERTEIHRGRELHRDFVANASHELRTPLATVAGCIETLRGHARDDPEASERFTGIMQRETDRMRQIVTDLLSLNSIEMQEHVRPTDRVDAVAIAREALASRPHSASSGTRFEAPDQPLVMFGTRVELLHALNNILANAEFHAGGASLVEVRRSGDEVEIMVSDQGPGVAREHVPRLTERFYRVNVADSRGRGGTGLGLAIVKHVVSRHKGELRIESEPGIGSRFTLRFGLAPEGGAGD